MVQLRYLCVITSEQNKTFDRASELRFGDYCNETSPRSGKRLREVPLEDLIVLEHRSAVSSSPCDPQMASLLITHAPAAVVRKNSRLTRGRGHRFSTSFLGRDINDLVDFIVDSDGVFRRHDTELNVYCGVRFFPCRPYLEKTVWDILSFPHPRIKQLAELEKRNQKLKGHVKAVELAKLMAEELWKVKKNKRASTLAAAARRFTEKTADMTDQEAEELKAVYTRCPLTWSSHRVCLLLLRPQSRAFFLTQHFPQCSPAKLQKQEHTGASGVVSWRGAAGRYR